MKDYVYKRSNGDHTLFIKHTDKAGMVVLIAYVDDILITWNDEEEIKDISEGWLDNSTLSPWEH